MIETQPASELNGSSVSLIGGNVDPTYVRKFAQVHEEVGLEDAIAYGRV